MDERQGYTPKVPALEPLLGDFGLTQTEIRAYLYLLKQETATPADIARETAQSRGKIYETMRRLCEKGLAREEPTRPIQYRATPLSDVISLSAAHLTRQTISLRAAQQWLRTREQKTPAVERPHVNPGDVRVLSGRKACVAEFRRMLASARRDFIMAGGGMLAQRLHAMDPLHAEFQAALIRGVRVLILLPPIADHAAARKALADQIGVGIVIEAPGVYGGPIVTVVSDQTILDIIAQPDDEAPNRGEDVAVRIDNATFADAARVRLGLPAEPEAPPND